MNCQKSIISNLASLLYPPFLLNDIATTVQKLQELSDEFTIRPKTLLQRFCVCVWQWERH